VCVDLENEGYEVQPFIIPAASKNAPHRRERCWFVAYSKFKSTGSDGGTNDEAQGDLRRGNTGNVLGTFCSDGDASDTKCKRLERYNRKWERFAKHRSNPWVFIRSKSKFNVTDTDGIRLWGESDGIGKSRFAYKKSKGDDWIHFPTQPPICSGDDGFPNELDGITISKWKKESLKAYGNAIVPQVAYEIFKAIEATIQGVD
jgi:DNA (cytosine-5)-methyltransferase 1